VGGYSRSVDTRPKLRRRARLLAVAITGLLTIAACVATPARAQEVWDPFFVTSPRSGEVGTEFTLMIAWGPYPNPDAVFGCAHPVGYAVSGPVSEGGQAPIIATGKLEANEADGDSYRYDTAKVTPTRAGLYVISGHNPDGSTQARCQGLELSGEFVVTEPAVPDDQLTVTPEHQEVSIDDRAQVTATLRAGESAVPVSGTRLNFAISGPNRDVPGTCVPADCVTGADGTVRWSYAGAQTGHDTINVRVEGGGPRVDVSVDWTPSVNGAVYAALGDSFSSGEGTGDYFLGTDLPGLNMCHRSPHAAAARLASGGRLGSFGFAACSGAITDDLFDDNHAGNASRDGDTEPAQLCRAAAAGPACGPSRVPVIGPNTRLVTLTIGGNDAGFAWAVSRCIIVSIAPLRLGATRGCPSTVTLETTRRLAALAGIRNATTPEHYPIHSITKVLDAIHAAAPNARVLIAGYPELFQPRSLNDCVIGDILLPGVGLRQLRVGFVAAAWMDLQAAALNQVIAAAARARSWFATYVNVATRFEGHGLCTGSSWINPIRVFAPTISPEDALIEPSSLHPNQTGQILGYEAAYRAAGVVPR